MNLPQNINLIVAKSKGQMNLPQNINLIMAKSKGLMNLSLPKCGWYFKVNSSVLLTLP
jgi:hypothetical protein